MIAAAIALLIATPIGIAVALFISHYAPRSIAGPLGYVIDLLAAIPSVIYGAWGYLVLAPALVPGYQWLAENLASSRSSAARPARPARPCSPPGSCWR